MVLVIKPSHLEWQAADRLGDLVAGPLHLVVETEETRLVGVVRQHVQLLKCGFQSLITRSQDLFELDSLGEVISLRICGVAEGLLRWS